jgi:tetratricopeptide (TPR) repeat protein
MENKLQHNFKELIRLADEAEKNENISEVIKYLNLALNLTEDKKPIYERLLQYYLNDSNPERALKVLKKLIDLDKFNPTYYKHLVGILLELDRGEIALKIADKAYSLTKDKYFKDIFDNSMEEKIIELSYTNETVSLLFTLFGGREGVYARQWKNSEGATGYIPVREPLSEKVIKNHLNGNITIGIYQHRLDSTVNWICFDVDIAKHILKNVLSNDEKFKEYDFLCHKIAVSICKECEKFNISPIIENSGYKGRHVWIFLEKPVPARIAKRFAESVKINIKEIIPEISVEIFPKQNFVKQDGTGNLVKLPLGIHLANGKRSFFVDKKGSEIANINELSYDEMIVVAHSIGHLETGVDAVNYIYSKCYNVNPDKFLKSRLKGNPISCAKIRSKVPEITSTVNCNCQFDNIEGLYPNPTLHLHTFEIDVKLPSRLDSQSLNFQDILDNYLKLKKQLFELNALKQEYEDKFEAMFKTSGVDVFKTAVGNFRRVVDENGKVTYKLDV